MQPTTVITGDDVSRAGESTALYDRIAMESDQGAAGLQVPHLQRFVIRRGNGPPAVRRHRHAIDRIRVAFQGSQRT